MGRQVSKRYADTDVADPTIILDHNKLVEKRVPRKPRKLKPHNKRNKRTPEQAPAFRLAYLRGDSYEEMKKRFNITHTSVSVWADELKLPRRYELLKKNQKVRLNLSVRPEDSEMLRAYCKKRKLSLSAVFHRLVINHIGDERLR